MRVLTEAARKRIFNETLVRVRPLTQPQLEELVSVLAEERDEALDTATEARRRGEDPKSFRLEAETADVKQDAVAVRAYPLALEEIEEIERYPVPKEVG